MLPSHIIHSQEVTSDPETMHNTLINSLIHRVDDFQKATVIETLEWLDTQKALLRDLILLTEGSDLIRRIS